MAGWEERAAIIARSGAEPGAALDGLYIAGRPEDRRDVEAAVIAPPHPLYGGSMDSPIATELAHGCARAALASLRFNWSGVGASAGEPSGDPAVADADYDAAVRHLAETHSGGIVACGYSFGAAAALRAGARHPGIARLLLVAPPPALLEPAALERFEGPTLIVSGERDAIAPPETAKALAGAHRECRLVRIPDADHFFGVGLAAVGRAAAEWLAE